MQRTSELLHLGSLKASVWLCVALVPFATSSATAQPALPAGTLFPAPGAKGVCPDTPLRIRFQNTPVAGVGSIEVRDSADDSLVATIDVATPTRTRTIGGLPNFRDHPVIISGGEATILLPENTLGFNKTYSVRMDAGAFKDATGAPYAGVDDAGSWRFSTRPALPAAGSRRITVAADNSGDFATVQGALDSIPQGNTVPTTIFIRSGTYREIVCFTNKHAVTLLGEDRKKTVIAYANNDRFNNNAGGNPFGRGAGPPGAANPWRGSAVYRRGMLLAHRVDDLVIANLTLHNTTPQGGSQAEAIILNGTPNARAIITSVDLISFQDTLQINGQAYLSDCTIEGDVDFMWGTGPCYFENCRARSLRNNAYYTQIRNRATNHGYVYKDCTFDGAPGVTGNVLSRIAPTRFPASEVVLIDCTLTDAVSPVAWRLDQATEAPGVHFWEFNSHDPGGKPIDTSRRLAPARQLKLPDDREIVSNYSDPSYVLGGGWTPKLPPMITAHPVAVAVGAGQRASFSVAALAVPRPTFQWRKDGKEIGGATAATYEIAAAGAADAGSYTVVVSNGVDTVTSAAVPLSLHRPGAGAGSAGN
jgi:pectin methylesterase-like acyl-CoA thioesterase